MAGYKVLGIEHVHITTPAELENDVVEWYQTCLNLEKIDKPEGTRSAGHWLRAGPQELHISLDEHNPPRDSHFGLVVDEFEPVIECLRDHGCHIEQATTIPGRHRFFTRDPAGNRVEIIHFDQSQVVATEEATADDRAQILHEEKTS
jgi:catechol 2,3-dioxygenase-like lactoylglutathione lyase family enzyme